jgi:hypothetical protein
MGSSRKSKSTRAKGARPPQRPTRPGVSHKAVNRPLVNVPEIPAGVEEEIERQRGSLVTVISLLHCLHVVLEQQDDTAHDELNPRTKDAVKWAYLPDLTAMLRDRTHAILHALGYVNLMKASKAFKP